MRASKSLKQAKVFNKRINLLKINPHFKVPVLIGWLWTCIIRMLITKVSSNILEIHLLNFSPVSK